MPSGAASSSNAQLRQQKNFFLCPQLLMYNLNAQSDIMGCFMLLENPRDEVSKVMLLRFLQVSVVHECTVWF